MATSTEGLLEFEGSVAPLTSISPTRFVAMDQCPLRELWTAARAPQLLPSSPAARLGTVIHRLLEEAGQGAVPGDAGGVDQRWQELVIEAERAMLDGWLERHFVPLSHSVADFEVRRIQARERALEVIETRSAARVRGEGTTVRSVPLHGCEVPVATADGRVRGRIDAVAVDAGGPVIRDYKSGAIFEPGTGSERMLKKAYEVQLRMYAALYADTTGTWPVRLEVVPVLGSAEEVAFDPEGCTALVEKARITLDNINDMIELSGSDGAMVERLARPRPDVCAHCAFRPACAPYRAARMAGSELWPHDVWGRLNNVAPLGADRLMMELDCGGQAIRIRNLSSSSDRHPALDLLGPGDQVAVFSARPTGSPVMFAESPFTVIYKVPERSRPRRSDPLAEA